MTKVLLQAMISRGAQIRMAEITQEQLEIKTLFPELGGNRSSKEWWTPARRAAHSKRIRAARG